MIVYNEEVILMQMFYVLQKKIVLETEDISPLLMLNDKRKKTILHFISRKI